MIDLSQKIKSAREKKGLTLEKLAEAVDSSKSYIWQLEKNPHKKPSFEIVVKIAEVLELPLDFLANKNEHKLAQTQIDARFLTIFNKLDKDSKKIIEALMKHLLRL